MPWKEATKLSERAELIRKWKSGLYRITELAEQFDVSRPTVYEWIERYSLEGEAGLIERKSIPKTCPHRTPEPIAAKIIEAKKQHPEWGPAKVIDFLRIEEAGARWPSGSTAGEILDRVGLVARRRRRNRNVVRTGQRLQARESGEMMTADHKGQFRMRNHEYCFPVTINDPVSRYIYAIDGKRSTNGHDTRQTFERVFREYGVPSFMGTDNGSPFSCSRALGGLSTLSVWWIKIGITPVRIHPGCPWENGVHERMHRTLKAATARPPGANLSDQQKRFDAFRHEFNTVRPHEALDGRRPADLLRSCARSYPRRILQIEYPGHYEARAVRPTGMIKWQGDELFVSESLAGERVGLIEIADGIWSVHFASMELGRYDERTRKIH